ncbi:peroxide stress protein YaaA [Magnetovibrio sp.]|uniref:peroxide stress protein YaaA n=1 Tax=Magnetovibrio sp. TaxID=2024836 RepID=UPI002F94460D
MLCVISPAKRLNLKDWDRETPVLTTPDYPDDTTKLAKIAGALDTTEMERLMHISAKQAVQVKEDYSVFSFPHTPDNAKPACWMFSGDTYVGLDAETLSAEDLAYAQDHLVILNGLYGKLRPLDLVRAHRLDMGARLENPKGKNLYEYWDDRLSDAIIEQAKANKTDTVVCLASIEYFKAARGENLIANGLRVITPVFKEIRENGEIKIMSLFAKRARGMMARWIVQNRITDAEQLKSFNVDGYTFQEQASEGDEWVFARPQPKKKTTPPKSKDDHTPRLRKYREGADA